MENKDTSKENPQRTDVFPNRMVANDDLGATCDLTDSASKANIDVTSETSAAVERTSDGTANQGTEAKREVTEGMQLGRYRIRSLLGEGGMGSVFLAYDEVLDRDIALKIPKFGVIANPETLQRFHREARIAANVAHPNLCPVFDVGEIDGWQFIAMAYINGSPLSDYTSRENLISKRVIAIIIQKVALALQEAHQSGVMHRDLKPANIMLDHREEPIVMDFGLAGPQEPGNDRLTIDGMVIGSPAYMSPEQIRGTQKDITHATDIYSLGVVLYEMLSGRLPYEDAESAIALIGQILTVEPPPVETHRADIDSKLAEICAKAMAKNVADRFESMKEFSDALREYLQETADQSSSSSQLAEHAELKERVKLARLFCETDRYAAAIPILEEILLTETTDKYGIEAREWAEKQLAGLKENATDDTQQTPKQPADLAGLMQDAFSGQNSAIPQVQAVPNNTPVSPSTFETSIIKHLYVSEKTASDQQQRQPEQKAQPKQAEQKAQKSKAETDASDIAHPTIADVVAELRRSDTSDATAETPTAKRQENQDETEQESR